MIKSTVILGVRVDPTSYTDSISQIAHWAQNKESRYVCIANVHMIMEAHDTPDFLRIVNSADLVTPDGIPLVWVLRLKGFRHQERVYGPDLMLQTLQAAETVGVQVGFFGSSPEVLAALQLRLSARFPSLRIVYAWSPPFRALSADEEEQAIQQIEASGARILFVGLGCPKQEYWMAAHSDRIRAVMLGVGAAFDFHAGFKPQAPDCMQKAGLEWLFRLASEPKRLWRRYLYHNPRFLWLAGLELIGLHKCR
jgi:N-acetylglucosaminyldiphosphoundecaprenol N-acetyl-beta-D-mannosaminyltransferase